MSIYLDISTALKLIVEEAESAVLAERLTEMTRNSERLVASMLLYTELQCAVRRRLCTPPLEAVTAVLEAVNLSDVERTDLTIAAAMPGRLRSTDAIHLATALRLGVDRLVAYDPELLSAARLAGLTTASPR